MTELVAATSWVVAAAGVAMAVAAWGVSRDLRVAVPLLLDLLLASGLLRLAAVDTWVAIAVAAVLVALRRLISLGLAAGAGPAAGLLRFSGPGAPWSPRSR